MHYQMIAYQQHFIIVIVTVHILIDVALILIHKALPTNIRYTSMYTDVVQKSCSFIVNQLWSFNIVTNLEKKFICSRYACHMHYHVIARQCFLIVPVPVKQHIIEALLQINDSLVRLYCSITCFNVNTRDFLGTKQNWPRQCHQNITSQKKTFTNLSPLTLYNCKGISQTEQHFKKDHFSCLAFKKRMVPISTNRSISLPL